MGQKYGQHFLHDQEVLTRIAESIDELGREFGASTLLEIGPGKGALTTHLLQLPYRLVLSEIDERLRVTLETLVAPSQTPIVWGDVLHHTFAAEGDEVSFGSESLIPDRTIVVGNLPYYITSPILRQFFCGEVVFPAGVFLIQQEVAEKIRRDAPKKSYLRWLVNRTHQVDYAFRVDASSFTPPPKVTSAVIIIQKMASPRLDSTFQQRLLLFLDIASPFKRKTLGKIQKMKTDDFLHHGFVIPDDLLGMRLEQLSRDDMGRILNVKRLKGGKLKGGKLTR